MDRIKMKKNGERILQKMQVGYHYSLEKLQEITSVATTDLCLAILVLIKEHKVKQIQGNQGSVSYMLC